MEERKQKNNFWKGALCGALAIFIAGAGAIVVAHYTGITLTEDQRGAGMAQQKIKYLDQLIEQYYLYSDEVTKEELEEGVYTGYIDALGDPYSVYYDEEETKSLFESTSGEYYGIGVAFSQNINTKISTAAQVYEGSPAEEAGVKVGDILYKVNGKDVSAEDLSEVVKEIKGEEGTSVELTVLRGEEMEEVTMNVTRRKIEVETVTGEMLEDSIGYIRIKEFDQVTDKQFEEVLQQLQEEEMEGLVVDLRSNPGGNVAAVVEILDQLLPEGKIVYTRDKNGKEEVYSSDEERRFEKPMAVLVNGYSASASEIFAGAIQDYEQGAIVGTTTYGKGIVQHVIPLPDDTCVKLTVSEYFTPLGRNIHKVGIVPDVEVAYEMDETNPEADNQLDAAIAEVKKELP